MRLSLPVALLVTVVLSGCAGHRSIPAPPPSAASAPDAAPVAPGESNRFEMTQNGQRMSADDFDLWMKARGIRVAKGPSVVEAGTSERIERRD